ncbi:MAG: FtsX-like permease family protein, partial [Thermoanaerobaculia bacterium]
QDPTRTLFFALRTTGDPIGLAPSARAAIQSLDRELPVFGLETMAHRTDMSLADRRSPMRLATVFGCIALFLSATGIYGVLAYLVTLRTREIAIRIALGGSAASICKLVLREGLVLVCAGLLAGGIGIVALRTQLQSQLFGVAPTDPIVLLCTTAALAVVAVVACAVPAWRATRIDPMIALAA